MRDCAASNANGQALRTSLKHPMAGLSMLACKLDSVFIEGSEFVFQGSEQIVMLG